MASVSKTKKVVSDRERFVSDIEKAIEVPSKEHPPFVFSQRIGATDAINTTVVTQAWKELSHEERSGVIVEAHRRHGDGEVTIALGLTLDEAAASGLLPYSIVPLVKQSDPVDFAIIREAMIKEGALETPGGPVLRFSDVEAARNVYRRL